MSEMSEDPGVDAVLFDMDGTLLDSWQALLGGYQDATTEVLGAPFPVQDEDVNHIIQLGARDVFLALAAGDPDAAVRIQAAFGDRYRARSAQIGLFAGVSDMLVALREQGRRLGVATSKSRARIDQDLEQTGIRHLLDAIVCGDEVPVAKPDPGPIIEAMKALSVESARAVYVGDGANDVLAARGAGTRAVGAGYGFHPEACRAAGPDYWIEAPSELPELVRAIGAGRALRMSRPA
jgi:2-phosphoglycolate phosphatase